MAVNATLNLALDRTSGRFSVDEGSTRLYVYDAAIDLSVGGWTRDEVAIGQDGKTMYEPYFQIVCGGMVLAEAKLNGVVITSPPLGNSIAAITFSSAKCPLVNRTVSSQPRKRFSSASSCRCLQPILVSQWLSQSSRISSQYSSKGGMDERVTLIMLSLLYSSRSIAVMIASISQEP